MAARRAGLSHPEGLRGLAAAGGAFAFWGAAPLYWKFVERAGPVELLAHRLTWSLPLLVALLAVHRGWPELGRHLRSGRTLTTLIVTTILIATNWFTFIWAVGADRVLEASLGYYITPLVNVLLGVVVLRERLERHGAVAVLLAALGVGFLVLRLGTLPWVSLVLAVSFGLYGLLRKTVAAGPIVGSSVEIGLLFPLAALWLGHATLTGTGHLGRVSPTFDLLLIAAGVITVVPLVAFTYGARRLTLTTVGFLQYLAPTGQLLLAVWVFGEAFSINHLLAFVLIWAGLAVYTIGSLRNAPS